MSSSVYVDICRTDAKLPVSRRIARCAKKALGCTDLPGLSVKKEPSGKPFFPDMPGLHLSITHAGDYWACAVAQMPVGVDLERPRRCSRASIERRFFHPDERVWLEGKSDADFFSVWTAKESFVKLSGVGITNGFSDFSVVDDGGLASSAYGVFFYHLSDVPGYKLCVCTKHAAHIEVALCF